MRALLRLGAVLTVSSAVAAFRPPDFRLRSAAPWRGGLGARRSVPIALDDEMLSPLIRGITASKTVEMHSLTMTMKAEGKEVISLSVGEPDFQPPPAVLAAATAALVEGNTKYTAVAGTLALRAAVAADLTARKGTPYAADEIIVSNGAKQSVAQALLAVCRPGDEVVVICPFWPSYPELVKLCGATPVLVASRPASEGYALDVPALAAALSPRTRAVILCSPSNPTGHVAPPAALAALAAALEAHEAGGGRRAWVLADEIYERLTYGDEPHCSFAAVPGQRDRTLLVNGFSKSHAMTGFRLGYLAAPREVVAACTVLQGQLTSCASSVAQAAGVAALALPDDALAADLAGLRAKRNFVLGALAAMPGVAIDEGVPPEGAFYALPDVTALLGRAPPGSEPGAPPLADDGALAVHLLARTGVALVAGSAFGAPGTLRVAYATGMPQLTQAMGRMSECFAELMEQPKA